MISESFSSLSNEIFLGVIASIGVVLYAGFAYLVAQSKNIEVRRRWRYSILWGVSFGVSTFIIFGVVSVSALFGDENELGYMAQLKSSRSLLDLSIGIFNFLVYPVLISLPFVFLVTFGTYWKERDRGDMFINRLLYPVKKHFSDQSTDNVIERLRKFVARLIDR